MANLNVLKDQGFGEISRLPYSIRVLLESCLRNLDGFIVNEKDVVNLAKWNAENDSLPNPGREVLQDFTGVPAVVDLAAFAFGDGADGGRPEENQSLVPCDLVIDHSVQVDAFKCVGTGAKPRN
ncbi:MAG: hypothetical protein R3C12_22270 [Planctomycetaceae bacterium]